MQKIFLRIWKSRFVRNVSIVFFGSAAAQLITIACTPIFTRVYGAESIGIYGLFVTVSSLLFVVSTGRYGQAVMLPKEPQDAANLMLLSLLISLFVSLLVLLVLPFRGQFSVLLNAPELAGYLLLLPVVILANASSSVMGEWCARNKMFVSLAVAAIVAALIGNSVRIGTGYVDTSAFGLILGTVVFFVVQFLMLLFSEWRRMHSVIAEAFSVSDIKALAVKYRRMPYFRVPKDLLEVLSNSLPVIMLAFYFPPEKVGMYYLVERVLRTPIRLVTKAIRQVYFQKSVEIHHENRSLLNATLKLTLVLAATSFAPFFLVILYSHEVFGYIFGSEWAQAGEYASWIALLVYLILVRTASVVVIPIIQAEKQAFIFEIISLLLRLIALMFGGVVLGSDVDAIALYALTGSILNIIFIVYVLMKIQGQEAITAQE